MARVRAGGVVAKAVKLFPITAMEFTDENDKRCETQDPTLWSELIRKSFEEKWTAPPGRVVELEGSISADTGSVMFEADEFQYAIDAFKKWHK